MLSTAAIPVIEKGRVNGVQLNATRIYSDGARVVFVIHEVCALVA
jgi:hypothetical protein